MGTPGLSAPATKNVKKVSPGIDTPKWAWHPTKKPKGKAKVENYENTRSYCAGAVVDYRTSGRRRNETRLFRNMDFQPGEKQIVTVPGFRTLESCILNPCG